MLHESIDIEEVLVQLRLFIHATGRPLNYVIGVIMSSGVVE